MFKMLRVLVMFLGALALLMLLAIIGLVIFVNPNDLKPQISQAVSKYTGRHLQLQGNIEWSIFPWLGLQLNDAQLSNADGFGDKPFAEIQKLDIQVRLLPLFHKQLEIGRLHLKGLTLHLVKNVQGQTNWQLSRAPSLPTAQSFPDKSPLDNVKPLGFVVAGIDIQNGHVIFDDWQENKHYELSTLQLKSANLAVNRRSPFFAQFAFKANAPKINATVTLTTDITLSLDGKQVVLHKLKLDTLFKDPAYPKGQLPFVLQTNAVLDVNNQSISCDPLVVTLAQNRLVGHITGEKLLDNPSLSGILSAQQFHLGKLLTEQVQLPFQFKHHILSVNPITGTLYQGSYHGDATFDLSTTQLRIIAHSRLTQVNMLSLFQEFNKGRQIQLAGLANIVFQVVAQGSDQASLIKTLQGKGQFNLDNGAIKGVNLSYWIALGKAWLKHTEKPPIASHTDTPFHTFSASFTLNNGVLANHDLAIGSGKLHINGEGSVDLLQKQIHYELQAQSILADGSPDGIAVPLRITGPLSHLTVVPVLDKLGIALARETLKTRLQNQLKNLDLKNILR